MENKQSPVFIRKAASSDYDATFIMSATTLDRSKDTIDIKAYRSNIGKTLLGLWQHKTDQVCGKWENIRVENDQLIGDLKLAGTNLGKMIKQLLVDDIPLGASIGFMGAGGRNKSGGTHFTKVELLECSIVSVPDNPRAMRIAKSFDCEEFITSDQSSIECDDQSASGRCIDETIRNSKAAILAAQKSIRL